MVLLIVSSSRESSATTDSSPSVRVGSSMARSRPALKVGPAPRTTTTRTVSGICSPIVASARHIAGVCALRTSGRSRVTVATVPSGSVTS